jgi:molybdate transport system ATP-binding protein
VNALVTLRRARVTLGGNLALDQVDFTLREGEHTVIQGRNGSGKSTLVRLIRGEMTPDQRDGGEVVWHTPEGPETFAAIGQRMTALVSTAQFENYMGKGWRINGETLLLTGFSDTPLLYAQPPAAQREAVRALAAQFGITGLLERELPSLSHGQIRILLLARACVRKPKILLLDEFTDGLDVQVRGRVNAILEKIAVRSTILAVAHRTDTLPECIVRSVRMEHGRIRADCPRRIESPSRGGVITDGAAAPGLAPCEPLRKADGLPLVAITNADVYVDATPVLRGINWRIGRGEHWAVIGHNGAGKSTLLRLICGMENVAHGGSIHRRLPGQGEGVIVDMERMRRGIGIVSDRIQATYWYDLTGENLVFSGFERSVGLFREPDAAERGQAYAWMERLGVRHLADRRMRAVSTGQLRRLMLARALVGNPDLVLLDEPCSGLDPDARAALLRLLNELAVSGVHCVLVTHHEADIFPAITHVAYLENGRMVRQGALTRDVARRGGEREPSTN